MALICIELGTIRLELVPERIVDTGFRGPLPSAAGNGQAVIQSRYYVADVFYPTRHPTSLDRVPPLRFEVRLADNPRGGIMEIIQNVIHFITSLLGGLLGGL